METKPLLSVVGVECAPEAEEKFNKWYTETHVPMILKSKWCDGATRYKRVPITKEEAPTYLAIYEFKNRQAFEAHSSSPELAAAIEEMKETWPDKGFELKWRGIYEPLKTWRK